MTLVVCLLEVLHQCVAWHRANVRMRCHFPCHAGSTWLMQQSLNCSVPRLLLNPAASRFLPVLPEVACVLVGKPSRPLPAGPSWETSIPLGVVLHGDACAQSIGNRVSSVVNEPLFTFFIVEILDIRKRTGHSTNESLTDLSNIGYLCFRPFV